MSGSEINGSFQERRSQCSTDCAVFSLSSNSACSFEPKALAGIVLSQFNSCFHFSTTHFGRFDVLHQCKHCGKTRGMFRQFVDEAANGASSPPSPMSFSRWL